MHSSQSSSDSFELLEKTDDGSLEGSIQFDLSVKEKINVSRNNLLLNTFLSSILLLLLILPYFLPWFYEESTVKSFKGKPRNLYFFLHKVWVPLPASNFIWGEEII